MQSSSTSLATVALHIVFVLMSLSAHSAFADPGSDLAPSELIGTADQQLAVFQKGPAEHSLASIVQAGHSLNAHISQNGADLEAIILQSGHLNSAMILQEGFSNDAVVLQSGSNNEASIQQQGAYNSALLEQTGSDKNASIVQSGQLVNVLVRQYR